MCATKFAPLNNDLIKMSVRASIHAHPASHCRVIPFLHYVAPNLNEPAGFELEPSGALFAKAYHVPWFTSKTAKRSHPSRFSFQVLFDAEHKYMAMSLVGALKHTIAVVC